MQTMDSMLSIKREQHDINVTTPGASPYSGHENNINDSFPRFESLDMTSPCNNNYAVVWPPTPPTINECPVSSAAYSFSMAPEDQTTVLTTSWEEQDPITVTHRLSTASEINTPPHHYETDDNDQWRPRGDFSMFPSSHRQAVHSVPSEEYGNGNHNSNNSNNSNGFLPIPGNYTYSPESQLRLNTDIDYRTLEESDLINSSTNSFFSESENNYHTPLSNVSTPLSPGLRARARGSISPSGPYRVSPYAGSLTEKRRSAPAVTYSSGSSYPVPLDPRLSGPPSHHSSPISPAVSYLPSQPFPPYELPFYPQSSPSYLPQYPQQYFNRYIYTADCPQLYSHLNEEPLPPPEEDMNPSDPDMKPRLQPPRFEGDIYHPRWVRGIGSKREGWCGMCKPGRWLVLKNSAFWYDKCFTHGISSGTGTPFQQPGDIRRMDGNPDVWEGLCSTCADWVPLTSAKKKGTTWFRHAYKCHANPKVREQGRGVGFWFFLLAFSFCWLLFIMSNA
ncbi:hypothetical protein BZA77DRAFT_53619 [Pyronema omphalodes]|nr:hypothetical protein BZA77DRAFT_53619 [Pyronema omphalodes]